MIYWHTIPRSYAVLQTLTITVKGLLKNMYNNFDNFGMKVLSGERTQFADVTHFRYSYNMSHKAGHII